LANALVKAQKEIKSAHKEANNPFFKSKYADLGSVWHACKDALNDNGLCIIQTMDVTTEGPILVTKLLHISGESIEGRCLLINLKGDMQGLGSAISYARRYSLAAICGVVSEDDDGEQAGTAHETKTHKKETTAKVTGDHIITFGKYKGKKVKEIEDQELINYCQWLRAKAKEQGKDLEGEPLAIEQWLVDGVVDRATDEMPNPFES
jgi:hypothetical protein